MYKKILLNTKRLFFFTAAVRFLALTPEVEAKIIHVSFKGSDGNSGTAEKPVATLYRAADLVREVAGKEAVEVIVYGGNYYLIKPLVLTAVDSGTETVPVTWRAAKGDTVRLFGGQLLDLKFEKYKGPVFKASVPAGTTIDRLFLNGKRQIMARYPNYDPTQIFFNGAAPTGDRMKGWNHPETAYIHGLAKPNWGGAHAVLKRDASGNLYEELISIDTTTPINSGSISPDNRFVENVSSEELDAPRQWFFDKKKHVLYFQPENEHDLRDGVFAAVSNPHLIRLEGDLKSPVKYVNLDGFVFNGASPTWKLTQDHLPNGGDFVVHRGGALFFSGTEDCSVKNCSFIELGGNAVFINGYNRRAVVEDCLIRNIGANGIALCGAEDAMRGDQFFKVLDDTISNNGVVRRKWEAPRGWYELPDDLTPGPKTENYPSECLVKGNLITVSGELEKQTAGVLLSMTKDNVISRNTIHKIPRAGICMNDNSWSGNIFEHNDVFDTVRETADHGPFNSWGKDRYWVWENHNGRHNNPEALQKYSLIDAMEPNHIRNNRFAHLTLDNHSFGIDLDDGSTNFRIYNNLTLGCGIKQREGKYRIVENNILIGKGNNVSDRHICMPDNHDVFRKNIVGNADAAIVIHNIRAHPEEMQESDYNCFFVKDGAPYWCGGKSTETNLEGVRQGRQQELSSIIADPMFVDPANGDYRVKPGSPALKLGFKNFPMEFGVTAPRLVKLLPKRTLVDLYAKTSSLKDTKQGKAIRSDKIETFMGCDVKNLTGEFEKTVVGIGEMTGVLIVTLKEGSLLARAGMHQGDLIIACNGQKVHDFAQITVIIAKLNSGDPIELNVHDNARERKYRTTKTSDR